LISFSCQYGLFIFQATETLFTVFLYCSSI